MSSLRRGATTRSALIAAAVVGLTACGSSGNPDTSAQATTPPPAEASTADGSTTQAAAAEPSTTATSTTATSATATPTTAASSTEAELSVVPAALVGATTIDGGAFDAEVLNGRPTVAWFWAPWCTVCRAEAPDVVEVVAEYSDRVNFVGVAGRGEAPEMREFVTDTGVESFIHLDDSSGEIWSAYEIYAQPAFAFITADGRVETFTGALGADDLASVVERLIAA